MGYGECDLHVRVGELEAQLAEGAQMHHRALGRCRELESLARDMWRSMEAMYRVGAGIDVGKEEAYRRRMRELGIIGESEES